jgi:rhodanese-related sulfurtransferase
MNADVAAAAVEDRSAALHARAAASSIGLAELLALLDDGGELALLDVRENGVYSQSHPFPAVSAPLSRLEFVIAALVPRALTPIVLLDDEDGLAPQAARGLARWGYANVRILAGGVRAWRNAGREVFSGMYVPSKAFGEYVSHACRTPALPAAELKRWQDEGRDFRLVDCRPFTEYHAFALPGSVNCPGAELPHCAFALASDPGMPIVVTCAGRTRGIVGAQALINAGVPNPVYVLDDGTAAWHLMGERLVEKRTAVVPPPTPAAIASAIESSQRVAQRYGVQEIDAATFARFERERGERSLFVLDVRTPAEYVAGHLPGARSAPGGQLVQSTDHYVGVRNARLVLVDDNGVRARFTASWLVQMGERDVYVLDPRVFLAAPAHEQGAEPVTVKDGERAVAVPRVPPQEVRDRLACGAAVVLDFDDSLAFRRGHIAGAWFAVRSRLDRVQAVVAGAAAIVCTSRDGKFAAYAAADLAQRTQAPVAALAGGTNAWRAAGLPIEAGFNDVTSAADDVWYNPYDVEDLEQSLRDYLKWEIDLIDQIPRERYAAFDCATGEPTPGAQQRGGAHG